MSSKYSKKRKQDDEDTSESGRAHRERNRNSSGSASPPPTKRAQKVKNEDNGEPAESMSIEETNKLRASLGLAPLETTENKSRDADDGTNEKIYNEDGFEFRHRKADNWAEKKREKEMKEKLEVAKAKRDIYSKVLKVKKLADSDDEDSAEGWIAKLREKQEEEAKAAERAKMFDQLDEELGVSDIVNQARGAKKPKRGKRKDDSGTAGLVVGHARDAFVEGDQILVLEDKGVLDDGDEVLVNPNFLDDERHKRNVELRKRKDPHRNFDEDVDEFGNPKNFGVLAKYDSELEGVAREKFRLDDKGGVNLEEERREMEMYRKLKMAGKRLETLEMPKYQLASEFYTQDEMVAFRKVKKGKKEKNTRKRKVLKASDLVPVETAGEGRDLGRRRRENSEGENDEKEIKTEEIKEEDVDISKDDDDGKWKKAMHGNGVDLVKLQKLKEKATMKSDDESSDDDMFSGGIDLTGVVIDDDAEDELHSVLSKTRKVKQGVENSSSKDVDIGKKVHEMISSHDVKMETNDEKEGIAATDGSLFIDSTMEYCRHIGEMNTIGIGGNRDDSVDVSELKKAKEEEDDGFEKRKRAKIDKELREREKRRQAEKGGWLTAGEPASSSKIDSDDEEILEEAKDKKWSDNSDEDEDGDYEPVLGSEVDVTKGVGAMMKLAAQKGYLTDPNAKAYTGPSLDHLKNKVRTQIDASRYDIEDKYMKKLDKLGTTGRGPLTTFVEKTDYKPEVNISYVDKKGRELDAKDAYRELSYKFHGRNPGKKQMEKRQNRKEKEDKMMKTNSYDTPLGTLSKQLKKQKQLATPYLVLSGSNDHSSLKKE